MPSSTGNNNNNGNLLKVVFALETTASAKPKTKGAVAQMAEYEIDEELFAELQALDSSVKTCLESSVKILETPVKTLESQMKTSNKNMSKQPVDYEDGCASTVASDFSDTTSDEQSNYSLKKLLKRSNLQSAVAKAERTIAELLYVPRARLNDSFLMRILSFPIILYVSSSQYTSPEATVMFADIVGFTAWSSIREATQVFTLLETIFSAFDDIANHHKVFKVETGK